MHANAMSMRDLSKQTSPENNFREALMPSRSSAQARLMRAAAHTAGGYAGVPQSVGREFEAADKAEGKYQGRGKKNATAKNRSGKTRAWTGK